MIIHEEQHVPPSHEQKVTGSTKQERETISGYALSNQACRKDPLRLLLAPLQHPRSQYEHTWSD